MTGTTVGVVIPTRGDGRGLRQAVTSVLGQEDVKVRLVVVVDSEQRDADLPDATVLAELGGQHRVVRLGAVGRPGPGRAVGSALVDAEFVALLDDDDVFVPTKLVRQLRCFEDPRVSIVGSNATCVNGSGGARPYHPPERLGPVRLRDALHGNPFITSTVVVRTSALQRVGGFPVSASLRHCDDYVTWLKLLTVGHGTVMTDQLVRYRVEAASSLSQQDDLGGAEARAVALRGFLEEASALSLSVSRRDRRTVSRLTRSHP